jgi:hypothetical protein
MIEKEERPTACGSGGGSMIEKEKLELKNNGHIQRMRIRT